MAGRAKALRYPARCEDCGAQLNAGDLVRMYRQSGRRGCCRPFRWVIYGAECHGDPEDAGASTWSKVVRPLPEGAVEDLGRGLYRGSDGRVYAQTRHGLRAGYEHTGQRCEDAPCCGCCS